MGVIMGDGDTIADTVITVEGFTSHRDNGKPFGEYSVKNVIPMTDPSDLPAYTVPVYTVRLW